MPPTNDVTDANGEVSKYEIQMALDQVHFYYFHLIVN
jgi:hypothetical protein